MGIGVVVAQFEVVAGEAEDVGNLGVDPHGGELLRRASELKIGLLNVITIEVEITKGVHEVAGLVTTDLGDHHGKQGVGGDVEGNSQEKIGTALVELAGEAGFVRVDVMHVELEQHVAGWQGHLIDFADIPRGDQMAA